MPSDNVITTLIKAFAGEPNTLLLAMVLFGIGFMAYRFVGKFTEHGDNVVKSLESMSETLKDLQSDAKELKVILSERNNK
jgi:hypothetical protein